MVAAARFFRRFTIEPDDFMDRVGLFLVGLFDYLKSWPRGRLNTQSQFDTFSVVEAADHALVLNFLHSQIGVRPL